MRSWAMVLVLQILVAAPTGWAQDGAKDRVIELEGRERLVLRPDGTMTHLDEAGKPVAMPEGAVMVAKDGSRLVMRNQSLWREILELAAGAYGRSIKGGATGSGPGQRSIELQDGGRIVLNDDGSMIHYDAAGNRLRMADGEVMMAKDGRQMLMVNGSLWTPESKRGAAKPAR